MAEVAAKATDATGRFLSLNISLSLLLDLSFGLPSGTRIQMKLSGPVHTSS